MIVSQGCPEKIDEPDALGALFEPIVWNWFVRTFREPSPAQRASWPVIAEGKSALIFSPTGSGKTLASFFWCINELFREAKRGSLKDSVYVLYVSPLKALNNDIQKNLSEPLEGIQALARESGVSLQDIRSEVRTGDTTAQKRAEIAKHPPHILITTPESLFIMLSTAKFREALRTVRYVIVDEIHAMSDNKRGSHLSLSLERLQDLADAEFARIGLSATQRPLERIARFLAGYDADGSPRPCEIINIGARKNLDVLALSPVDNLLEASFDAIWGSAYARLISHIRERDTTLIFANSRYKTERTTLRLSELSAESPISVGAHHGSMSKNVRLEMENQLKRGELDALVATSSLELGIDVGGIDLVCQIESPKSVSKGMQRIGRAGHLLNATSVGRLLAMDRDDLMESAALVKAIMDGEIESTRIPNAPLDVLAQHVVGAAAADEWNAGELFDLFRRSYAFRDLTREAFDRVLEMLSGHYVFEMEKPPYPKISWDRVNDVVAPERSSRMIAFRSSGTIPDVADYDVYFEEKKTVVGQLDEGFVEEIHVGDIFILGSSAWKVLGIKRNRVFVKDVYGQAPTIPFWTGDRDSRTYDLGIKVGEFRREMEARLKDPDALEWLRREYFVDENGARSLLEYFREQLSATGTLPTNQRLLAERFSDELGQKQIVLHASFGIRVNDPWAMALRQAIRERYGYLPQTATVDDGILLTSPKDAPEIEPEAIFSLVTPESLDALLERAVLDSPLFASRFRHNAVRSLMVLREYQGKRTPVWIQSLRASALLEACREDRECPLISETLRECLNESLDVPNLRSVLERVAAGEIETQEMATRVPSPFTHSLLLLGQYGDVGAVSARERRSRLIHLHRELLKQILDGETLKNLLDSDAVDETASRLQYLHPQRKARTANELARVLYELGDLSMNPDEDSSPRRRADGDADAMIEELIVSRRACAVQIATAETDRLRWISTENFTLYRAAFASDRPLEDEDRRLLERLEEIGPSPLSKFSAIDGTERRMERLLSAYLAVRVVSKGVPAYASARRFLPESMSDERIDREDARRELIRKFLRTNGPVTKYEIMERYGFSSEWAEAALQSLHDEGFAARGEYVSDKSFPQWCCRSNLEEIHRLTLNRLRKEMEPATPEEYADFLIRHQHAHPETRVEGVEGLREIVGTLQGMETLQVVYERDAFPLRVKDYDLVLLDSLRTSGEIFWRRFDYKTMKRGRIGFGFRRDAEWLAPDPRRTEMKLDQWDEDIPEICRAVREFLAGSEPVRFEEIVARTGLDPQFARRAVWHLLWTGEAMNDDFNSIRYASFTSGLSGAYDLFATPKRGNVPIDYIIRHMDNRHLEVELGLWSPTERLAPPSEETISTDAAMERWAHLLLKRYGVVSRESLKEEGGAPGWKELRPALTKLELLGKVRRGFFVLELSGEQYAYPETVEALRDAKLRHPDASDAESNATVSSDEPMILLNASDPANPYGMLFPLTDEGGEEVKVLRTPTNYLVIQGGRPILHFNGMIRLLSDLSLSQAEAAMRALMQLMDRPIDSYDEICIRDWNGHPIDISPARHLLTRLGFVPSATVWKGCVYDGERFPDEAAKEEAERLMPERFERLGKEAAPVLYDADWFVSRSPDLIRSKVQESIQSIQDALPDECQFSYWPRGFHVRYKGVRCIGAYIQQKQMWIQVSQNSWSSRICVTSDTDVKATKFMQELKSQFERSRQAVDLQ